MVSKGVLLPCHGLIWAGAIALALWGGAVRGAVRYDTATPYAPPYNKHKYIPIHGDYDDFESNDPARSPVDNSASGGSGGMPLSQFLLSALRTALEVVRNMNKQRPASNVVANTTTTTTMSHHRTGRSNSTAAVSGRELIEADDWNNTDVVSGRGYYDEPYFETTTTPKPMKARYTDPWAGYYDWIINEGSFKFWSVFQLFTAALLLYACFSAIYYAKFNPILPDYSMEYDDYFLERTVGRKARSLEPSDMPSGLSWINPRTFQFILDAISHHYEQS